MWRHWPGVTGSAVACSRRKPSSASQSDMSGESAKFTGQGDRLGRQAPVDLALLQPIEHLARIEPGDQVIAARDIDPLQRALGQLVEDVREARRGGDDGGGRLHQRLDGAQPPVIAVLRDDRAAETRVIDRLPLAVDLRRVVRRHAGEHQGQNDVVVESHLEDHQDRGERRLGGRGEESAHADQRISRRNRGGVRHQAVQHAPDQRTDGARR